MRFSTWSSTRRSRAVVVAVGSGWHGADTADLSIDLAVALARLDQRVLLLDAALGAGGACARLGLPDPATLEDVRSGVDARGKVIHPGPEGIGVVAAAGRQADILCQKAVARALKSCAPPFDYLMIDCGLARIAGTLGLIAHADEVLMVLTPEAAALRGAYRMVMQLALDHGRTDFLVVTRAVEGETAGVELFHHFREQVEQSVPVGLVHLGAIAHDAQLGSDIAESALLFRDYLVAAPPASGRFFQPEIENDDNHAFV